jgi:hypothetical protein
MISGMILLIIFSMHKVLNQKICGTPWIVALRKWTQDYHMQLCGLVTICKRIFEVKVKKQNLLMWMKFFAILVV